MEDDLYVAEGELLHINIHRTRNVDTTTVVSPLSNHYHGRHTHTHAHTIHALPSHLPPKTTSSFNTLKATQEASIPPFYDPTEPPPLTSHPPPAQTNASTAPRPATSLQIPQDKPTEHIDQYARSTPLHYRLCFGLHWCAVWFGRRRVER